MKVIVVLVMFGAILYLILGPGGAGPGSQKPELPKPPVVVPPVVRDPAAETRNAPKAEPSNRTTVNFSRPKPEAKASSVALLKGAVVSIAGELATVDCSYVPPARDITEDLPPFSNLTPSYKAKLQAQAQADANRKAFGDPQSLDADGSMVPATWVPKQRLQGMVVVTGVDVAVGNIVHCLVAPAGTKDGTLVFTTRFNVVGATWMWSETGRAALDSK